LEPASIVRLLNLEPNDNGDGGGATGGAHGRSEKTYPIVADSEVMNEVLHGGATGGGRLEVVGETEAMKKGGGDSGAGTSSAFSPSPPCTSSIPLSQERKGFKESESAPGLGFSPSPQYTSSVPPSPASLTTPRLPHPTSAPSSGLTARASPRPAPIRFDRPSPTPDSSAPPSPANGGGSRGECGVRGSVRLQLRLATAEVGGGGGGERDRDREAFRAALLQVANSQIPCKCYLYFKPSVPRSCRKPA
jgi:hypothetical protein